MHRELQQAAYERELQLLSMTVVSPEATRRELQAVRDLVGLRVGALIVASGTIPSDDLAEIVGEVPTLVLGRPEAHPRLHNVSFDEYRHGMMLADQVVSVGYRRAEEYHARKDAGKTFTGAVLVRKNRHSAAMAAQLQARGIPVEVVSLSGLLDVPEVADVIAFAAMLVNPLDTASPMWGSIP